MSKVTITIEGEVGSGKSALLGKIAQLMEYLDIPVTYENPVEAQSERNSTNDNWESDLKMYQPSVHLVEKIKAAPRIPTADLFVKPSKAPTINDLIEKHKTRNQLREELDEAIEMEKLRREKEMSRKAFLDSMKKTSEIVDSWPDWKKNWKP